MSAGQFKQSSLLRHTQPRHGMAENVNIGTGIRAKLGMRSRDLMICHQEIKVSVHRAPPIPALLRSNPARSYHLTAGRDQQ